MAFRKIFIFAFFLKFALYLDVVLRRLWHMGDSGHYMFWGQKACEGEIFGDPHRMPLYSWFLSIFSGCTVWRGKIDLLGGGAEGPLLGQMAFTLLAGFFLYRTFEKKLEKRDLLLVVGIWLFDPVLFAYSNFIMSDILFAVNILFTAYYFYKFLEDSESFRYAALFAVFFSLSLLTRAAGLPLGLLTAFFIGVGLFKKTVKPKRLLLIASIVVLFLTPRLISNYKKTGEFTMATQGAPWSLTVVAAVDYYDRHLPFYETEVDWFNDHPHVTPADGLKILLSKWKIWALLSLKGVARVFFGHVNIEYIRLITGKTVVGPGFFKAAEGGEGGPMSGFGNLIAWSLGILLVLIYNGWFYRKLFLSVKKNAWGANIAIRIFTAWALSMTLVMALLPQIFGDARFRLGFWPILLILYAILQKKKTE